MGETETDAKPQDKPKTDAKPQAPAKAKPYLDVEKRHLGTFRNWKGQEHAAYVAYNDDKRGFEVKCAKTHRAFKPVVFQHHDELKHHKVSFLPSGKSEPIK